MKEAYRRIKGLVGEDTVGRGNFIQDEIRQFGYTPAVYQIDTPRGKDKHITVRVDNGASDELWLTANYDTFGRLPSANNNASGVVSLLGLLEYAHDNKPPINLRLVYFDGGLDPDLVHKKKRNPDFTPGSEEFVKHMLEEEIDFIETFDGALAIQAVGRGPLCVFERTGRKGNNSKRMNGKILELGKALKINVDLKSHSPNADNESFLKEDLEATVLARYHEGSWHRMQTKGDDLNNVNVQDINETAEFLFKLAQGYNKL